MKLKTASFEKWETDALNSFVNQQIKKHKFPYRETIRFAEFRTIFVSRKLLVLNFKIANVAVG